MKSARRERSPGILETGFDELFGPMESVSEEIQLDVFTENVIRELEPRFSHRNCRIIRHIAPTPPVFIPKDVLYKLIEGLLRNAIENTPDSGVIEVGVRGAASGSELEIRDYGVGITAENQKLIFESHVTTMPSRFSTPPATPMIFMPAARALIC